MGLHWFGGCDQARSVIERVKTFKDILDGEDFICQLLSKALEL